MVSASVVICAYTMDRWEDLKSAIASSATGEQKPEQIIVVIDHNDVLLMHTRTYVGEVSFGGKVRVVPNSHRRGLSGARNTALDLASEDVVVFLDDDATATTSWLSHLLRHYADDTVVGVGGEARPVWPADVAEVRPTMFPAADGSARGELDWVVGCTYQGQPEKATPVRNLMGCNMSFRRSVFVSVAGFSEDLGRVGKTPLGCEETEFCIRVRQRDSSATIIFEPRAVVHHRVTADRVRWRYLIKRSYAEGLSKSAVANIVGRDIALESERSYVKQVLVRAVLREIAKAAKGRSSGWLGAGAIFAALGATVVGYLRGSVQRLSHEAHRGKGSSLKAAA
jgi:GT2 family glycosyltransferase